MADDHYTTTLDQALAVRERLNADARDTLHFGDYPDLLELLYELNDWARTATPTLAAALHTNAALLNKFFNQKKPVRVRTAQKIADNIVTHLRAQAPRLKTIRIEKPSREEPKREIVPALVIQPVEWKLLVRTPDLQDQINEVTRLVGEITRHAKTANLPPGERALSEIERAQLIAVLETALAVLKAPMVEKGLLKKAGNLAKRAAAKAAEKQVEIAFGTASGLVGTAILELLKRL